MELKAHPCFPPLQLAPQPDRRSPLQLAPQPENHAIHIDVHRAIGLLPTELANHMNIFRLAIHRDDGHRISNNGLVTATS